MMNRAQFEHLRNKDYCFHEDSHHHQNCLWHKERSDIKSIVMLSQGHLDIRRNAVTLFLFCFRLRQLSFEQCWATYTAPAIPRVPHSMPWRAMWLVRSQLLDCIGRCHVGLQALTVVFVTLLVTDHSQFEFSSFPPIYSHVTLNTLDLV